MRRPRGKIKMSDNSDPITEELAVITEIGWRTETHHSIALENGHSFIAPERIIDIWIL